jgi:hypothetical protein
VVVVPYHHLLNQHLENAKSMGCRAMQWITKMGVDAIGTNNLIFVAMETAASPAMKQ